MAALNDEVLTEAAGRNIDQLGINYDELPRRPFWAPFLGSTEHNFKIRIAARVMQGSLLTGRELTQPEKDALAQHHAKFLVTQAWDTPAVVATALAMYRTTYATYGFPFWTPKADKFNPNKMPLTKTYYEGFAPKVWHSLRLLAWFTGCKLVVGSFFFSYGLSVYLANYRTDPRLRSFHEAVQGKYNQKRRATTVQPDQQSRTNFTGGQETSSSWGNTEQSYQDSQSTRPETQRSLPEREQGPFRDEDPYVFDDASPVAPTEQQKSASQQASQGSAWDRIRNQARPRGAAQGQGSTGQTTAWGRKREDEITSRGAREGTSFSYSSGDEEKAYAKEQAQKEFDDMLERERRDETSGRR